MSTTTDTTTSTGEAGSRGFVALLLLTAGVLLLTGQVLPLAGDALALVLGVELLAWAHSRGESGLLVTGGLLTGTGAALVLAAGPLLGAEPHVTGGTFGLGIAVGFALVAGLSRLWWNRAPRWAWITAVAVGAVGASLLAGPDRLNALLTWALPAALLVGGSAAAVRWFRTRR